MRLVSIYVILIKNSTPKKSTLKTTIPIISKEWSVALEIKPKGTTNGWTSVFHMTAKGNCCGRGDRVPAIFFHSRATRMHICTQIDWHGNRCKDTDAIPLNVFTKVIMKQVKVGSIYQYTITVGSKVVFTVNNSRPTIWYNVKVYMSDPWHNAANAEIKNFEFKNLATVYPCPNMCKAKEFDATIDGKQVKAVSYQFEQCLNLPISYQVKVPASIRTPRLSCFKFYYKVGDPIKQSLNCPLDVFFKRHRLFRVKAAKKDEWTKVQFTVKQYIPYGENESVIGLRSTIYDRCSDVQLAGLQLMDGVCDD